MAVSGVWSMMVVGALMMLPVTWKRSAAGSISMPAVPAVMWLLVTQTRRASGPSLTPVPASTISQLLRFRWLRLWSSEGAYSTPLAWLPSQRIWVLETVEW